MAQRTDIHRPSAPGFDPEAYELRGVFDWHPEDGDFRDFFKYLKPALLADGYRLAPHASISQCGHCGSFIRYAAVMAHAPSMEYIVVGEDCLANRFEALTASEFQRLRKDATLNRQRSKLADQRSAFIEANPVATQAILMAVMEAQQWCDASENKDEMAQILGKRSWFNVPPVDVAGRLKGDINYGNGRMETATGLEMKFWKDHASYPFKSHDAWFLTENVRWGYLPASTDIVAAVDAVNREDIWRAAAATLGIAAADIPDTTSRGPETFFDGKVFDPADPSAYLDSLAIKAMV